MSTVTGTPNRPSPAGWILGPGLDLLLIANVLWPLLALWPLFDDFASHGSIQFWQIYFITTPHRWSTLGLVALDRDAWRTNPRFIIGLAAVVIAICVGVRIGTGGLTCLLAIDYVWNAWHFAAQHHGVYRIYGRLSRSSSLLPAWLEKTLLRTFILYCILRVAQVAARPGDYADTFLIVDWFMLLPAVVILLDCLANYQRQAWGRIAYLTSVIGLFVGLLGAVHARLPAVVLTLTTASAWFHASEYLAVVGWRMQTQSNCGGTHSQYGLYRWIASRWAFSLAIFVVILGSCGWLLEHHFLEFWLLINVIAAFLHYGYDGILWKKRKSEPSPPAMASPESL